MHVIIFNDPFFQIKEYNFIMYSSKTEVYGIKHAEKVNYLYVHVWL